MQKIFLVLKKNVFLSRIQNLKNMTIYVRTLMAICLCVMSSALCMGQNVTIYDTSNSGLIDNDLWAVVVDHDGNKWLGTIKYGLATRSPFSTRRTPLSKAIA